MASNCGGSGWVHVAKIVSGTAVITGEPLHDRCPGCAHEECPNGTEFGTRNPMFLAGYKQARQEERDRVKPILEALDKELFWTGENWYIGGETPVNPIGQAVAEYRKQVEG